MKYLPTDVSTFSKMIAGNYVYVDKTEYIYNLVKEGASNYYFLSRPRRFGRTLLISTLYELFSGKKELFKNLWIAHSDYKWVEYPVIRLDFSAIAHRSVADLERSTLFHLHRIADSYGITLPGTSLQKSLVEDTFYTLIVELSKINLVVLLIDEYDKPILDHLRVMEEAVAHRNFLKSLYDVLKGLDAYLRCIFITGVSKFAKTSILSGINGINDISLKPEAASLLGYTQEEITHNFAEYIQTFTQNKNINAHTFLEKLCTWYNGYRFTKEEIKVYNPFSVLYCLKDQKFSNYWFEHGTPSFLINLLKAQPHSLENIEPLEISSSSLESFDLEKISLIPQLLQAGYLTFSSYNANKQKYTLGFPNYEVEESFKKYLVPLSSNSSPIEADCAFFSCAPRK
jgi:hypothetical protein